LINNNSLLYYHINPYCDTNQGIYVSYSGENVISNNNIIKNIDRWGDGISISYSQRNLLVNNYVTSTINQEYYGNAISMWKSNRNFIKGNTLINYSYDGINMYASSNNTIFENTIENNGCYGINLWYSWLVEYSNDNLFYHNNLINNSWGNVMDMCSNKWNNSYPDGGNYWDDFEDLVGPRYDNFSGPYQNESGSDGIIDLGGEEGGLNPYPTAWQNYDYYPLLTPWD